MFSNLRKSSESDLNGYEDNGTQGGTSINGKGGGKSNNGRHSSALRELGALLRERREAMGVSLAEVEVATRIRQKYLSALEADEWHLLPGEVVGRGFLRNYSDYLGLEPDEVIDRRRAVSDSSLGLSLANTSAGSNLPPLREVDYRPKEVDLKDEGDGIQRGEIRLTPIFAILGVAVLVVVAWWSISTLAGPLGTWFADLPAQVAGTQDDSPATPDDTDGAAADAAAPGTADSGTADAGQPLAGVVNPENLGTAEAQQSEATTNQAPAVADGATNNTGQQLGAETNALTGTGGPVNEDGSQGAEQPAVALVPTNTPANSPSANSPSANSTSAAAVIAPTATAEPSAPVEDVAATTGAAAILVPTPTPTQEAAPEPAAVAAATCADARSAISVPGLNQVVSGVLGVSGVATHDSFQYFKLEYAPGANVNEGFVYFAGSNSQVNGGVLGNLDTRALPNGPYTIRLTVVDQTSNYPPPCDVSFVIQN